jgi:hypothetical protein
MSDEMEVKCSATVYFYRDSFEKPVIILQGDWTGKELSRIEILFRKQYRHYLRERMREGKSINARSIKDKEKSDE